MLARPKIVTGNNARNYFEIDTYYLNNEFEQGSFYGKLKDDFGLSEFNLKDFDSLLKAQNPQTGEELLKLTKKDLDENGERKRAALDLTFAADKSVSILYEVSNEDTKQKIRDAFAKSIDSALDFAEANYSNAKSRDNIQGNNTAQSKLLFARFDHSESRNNDMHLHQHCLMINMIQDRNGEYKSIEFNQTMINHQLLGQIQRNEFAKELQKLGFEVEVTNAKNGTFSLKNVERNTREQFSTRSKDIKDEMKASGQTSYKSTHTAQKQTAKWKDKNKNREAIQEQNIQRLIEVGADIEKIQSKNSNLQVRELLEEDVVKIAFEDITDKKSVFKREDILKHSLKVALTTTVSLEAIEKEFSKYKDLILLDDNQYTTKEILQKEEYIFSKNENINFKITKNIEQINKAIKEFEEKNGFILKDGQNQLVNTLLTSDKQFIIAQGVAGAGKSTSFEIVNNIAEQTNRKIIALAPTGTATDNLSKEAGIKESYTVAKFIQENGADVKDALVIVDEAGMMGLKDTMSLLKLAEENNLKIVFSGDKNQKKSIQQGDIFTGMQRQGFETIYLNEGNRQKTDLMRDAVKSILDKDIVNALNLLKDTTSEITDSTKRLNKAQTEYLKDRNNSLLITTTNSDRKALNQSIRNCLIEQGKITQSKEFQTREIPSMSNLEKRSAIYYQTNEKIYLSKNIGSISAGREATITNIDIDLNTLTLEHKGKNQTFTEIVDLSNDGDKLNLYKETKTELGIGDQIITKKNDTKLGLKNGQIGTIINISNNNVTVQINKKEVSFNTKQYPYIQHAYAITDFASQGKTTDKVIAVANSQCASFNDFYTQITRAKYEAHIITDNLEELQIRAKQDSVKLNATEILQQIKIQEEQKNMTSNKTQQGEAMKVSEPQQTRITQEEFQILAKQTKDELKLADPKDVLDALGIDYKIKNNRYVFKVREENSASANMYIDAIGEWKYKDFGSGNNGTIENLVMDTTNASYKESLEYAVANSGSRDYVQEKLNELSGTQAKIKTDFNLEVLRQKNIFKAESQSNSKVTGTYDVETNEMAVEYLKTRGINKIPKNFKVISGEYTNKKDEVKKVFGVGILTEDGKGADIHFLKKLGNLKTMSLGKKDISFFKSKIPSTKIAVFESKMDYASAYQQIDFTNIDVIIANSTSNVHKTVEKIKDKYKSVDFYNQNDESGRDFAKVIVDNANLKEYSYIKYTKDEEKQDINDLLLKGVNINKRVGVYNQKEKLERGDNEMKKTKEELRNEYKKLMKQFTVVIEGQLTEEQTKTNERVEPILLEIEKELEKMNEMKNYFRDYDVQKIEMLNKNEHNEQAKQYGKYELPIIQKETKVTELTLFQQAMQAIKQKQEQVELVFGKERVETAKECIDFFKNNQENIEDVKDEEVKNESIFERVKEVVHNGYKLTKEWLKTLENEREEKIEVENNYER